ncbi:MAG: hypothetical protein AYK23_02535 [Candidatus Proteinoplasmatales archaeon SG8-5]|nr:MAG: hypothetical protein AYK23_02535 [Candidatus Proteinoplasmatales archaeon SG8-5]
MLGMSAEGRSAAQVTRDYIDAHPSVRDAIKRGIVNYSALARAIMVEKGLTNEEAVLVAARRHSETLRSEIGEARIRELLKMSSLEIRTKICIITARNDWSVIESLESLVKNVLSKSRVLQVIQGTTGITVITEEETRKTVEDSIGTSRIIKTTSGLAQITVKSPDTISEIPGVMAYLSSVLAGQGINVIEVMSCHTDTIFIVEEKDMMMAMDVIGRLLKLDSD